jgi:L-alanine-DL-glutamate epimerase-like enolase superfamily enzyme
MCVPQARNQRAGPVRNQQPFSLRRNRHGNREDPCPFRIGKNPDRIEDLWQSTNVRSYWRNSTIQNNILGALDMALWVVR